MEISRTEFLPGVGLTVLSSDEFRGGRMSVHLLTPLSRQNASLCAALTPVLALGSVERPSEDSIAEELSPCGGHLISGCKRFGEVNDSFLGVSYDETGLMPERMAAMSRAAAVLGQVLQSPRTDGGRLSGEFVEKIRNRLKNGYEISLRERLLQLMCPAEPYGAPLYGTQASIERLSVGTLTPYYRNTLSSAAVDIIYCGSLSQSAIIPAVRESFSALPARNCPFKEAAKVRMKPVKNAVRRYAEEDPVSSTAVGFRIGESIDEAEAAVLEELLGLMGFEAVADRIKGVLTVCGDGVQDIETAVSQIAAGGTGKGLFENACEHAARHLLKNLSDFEAMENLALEGMLTGMKSEPSDLGAKALSVEEDRIRTIVSSLGEDAVLELINPQTAAFCANMTGAEM